MPLIDPTEFGMDEAQEPYAMPDGHECRVTIVQVRNGKDKNGNPYIMPVLEVEDEPYSKEFSHYLPLPASGMTPKRLNRVRNDLKKFYEAFGIDMSSPTDPSDDWPGKQAWAILGVSNDDQYGEQNHIKQFQSQ